MKAKFTGALINNIQVTGAEYEIHDTDTTGLFIRVTANGAKSYVVTWARGRKKTLGRVGKMTMKQAQAEAHKYLSESMTHGEPLAVSQGRKGSAVPTLRDFIDDTYLPWFNAHHKGHDKTKSALDNSFAAIMARRLRHPPAIE